MIFAVNGVFTDSTDTRNEYDAAGNHRGEYTELFKSDTLSSRDKTLSTYDAFGNMTSVQEENFVNNSGQYGKSTLVLRYHPNGTY